MAMGLIERINDWRRQNRLQRQLREQARDVEFDPHAAETERRSAIPIDVTDVTSLPDRFIRDLRCADTWF
jgi:hypothetical protein